MTGSDEFEILAGRLEAIAEELDDLITDRLRTAVSLAAEGTEPDPAVLKEERQIARARRSVAKAAAILRPPPID
jgi:hypothetical protein